MRAAQPTVQISTVEGDRSEAQRVLLSSTPCVQEDQVRSAAPPGALQNGVSPSQGPNQRSKSQRSKAIEAKRSACSFVTF